MTKLKDQATNIGPKTAYFTCILISTRFDLPFPCSLCVKVENKLVETLEEQLLPGFQKENYLYVRYEIHTCSKKRDITNEQISLNFSFTLISLNFRLKWHLKVYNVYIFGGEKHFWLNIEFNFEAHLWR